MTTNIKKFLIPIAILAVAFIFFKLMVATKEAPPAIDIQEHVWRVEQSKITSQKLSPIITLYGKVETSELFNAAAPAQSQVKSVLFKEGESVQKDQLMLTLEPEDFEPLLMQAQGKVNELKAQIKSELLRHEVNLNSLKNEEKLLRLSEKALARAEQVKRKNLGSLSETEQAMQQVERQRLAFNSMQFSVNEHEARIEQLQARLVQAEADLAKNRLALKRSEIYAPFTGIIAKVNVAQGDRVNSNEKLLSFYSLERLEVRAKLPIHILSEIQNGVQNGQQLKGYATSGDQLIPIVLERLSGEAQASGVDAIFTFQEKQIPFRLGAIVVVHLQRVAQENVFLIPHQAIYGADKVYKIIDNRLQAVRVQNMGEYFQSDDYENQIRNQIPSGLLIRSKDLKSGDSILSTHLPNAVSGLKVDIVKQ